MRAILLFGIAVSLACGNARAPRSGHAEPTGFADKARGEGFWCVGKYCVRTLKACKTVRSNDGIIEECTHVSSASCFVSSDRDNMRAWVLCYRDEMTCSRELERARREQPEWLEFTRCGSEL